MNMQSTGMLQPSLVSPVSAQGAKPGAPMSKKMAQEFESLMLSQLIKQMRQSSGGEGLFPGDKSDTYGGMFDMMIGKFLSESGGFGLADQLAGSFQGIGFSGVNQESATENFADSSTIQRAQQTYESTNAMKE